MAAEKKIDQKELFKEAMKHATEEIQIADLADQLRQGRIPVAEAELQAYFDQNRQQFGEKTLTEVKEEIRRILVVQKEPEYLKGYLQDLKERASLQVDYTLLDVPEPTEQELLNYYQSNRERFSVPERAQVAQIQVSVSRAGGDEKARATAESLRAEAAAGSRFRTSWPGSGRTDRKRPRAASLPNGFPPAARSQAFDDAVFTLTPGDLSPVFLEGDSYFIVKLLAYEPETQLLLRGSSGGHCEHFAGRARAAGLRRTARSHPLHDPLAPDHLRRVSAGAAGDLRRDVGSILRDRCQT